MVGYNTSNIKLQTSNIKHNSTIHSSIPILQYRNLSIHLKNEKKERTTFVMRSILQKVAIRGEGFNSQTEPAGRRILTLRVPTLRATTARAFPPQWVAAQSCAFLLDNRVP